MEEELLKVRKLESVGILAGGIAHDFNNILAAILGNISLVLTTADPKGEIYELLVESEKASLRAKDLTQQLLTFAKGGEPVKKIAVIDEVIKESASFVLSGSNIHCDFKLGKDLWPVAIDTGQISQAIQNIIINASQAMPTGGTIAVEGLNYYLESNDKIPLSPGNYIKIVVKDQGVGSPADMLDKIFDPYFTTKQAGNGLGLAITHTIISKHEGYITVNSELGRGTTFTIYLPASIDRPELDQKDVTVPPATERGRVMIMDDEEMIRSLVEKSLSRIGYEVVSAEDGDEAVRLYRESKKADAPIDLIIMDLTIPGGMGGKDTVKEIHKIDSEAKVLVSSGYSNDPVMANFSEYGFCGAIVKPFQIRESMEIVGKAVSS
ncbi:MAG: ATP-binding protein [Pseudomonadota bacterium]|nr:ATP-binding protein [Pseudomonadota bacterium]